MSHMSVILFFFNDTPTTEIYTLSLHDALPISNGSLPRPETLESLADDSHVERVVGRCRVGRIRGRDSEDRKSTRLNSSHITISYAVFCLKKKKKANNTLHQYTSLSPHDYDRAD